MMLFLTYIIVPYFAASEPGIRAGSKMLHA